MTIGFIRSIRPTLTVLEDQRVTTSEVSWLTQEWMTVMIMVVMMTAFWSMVGKFTAKAVSYEY